MEDSCKDLCLSLKKEKDKPISVLIKKYFHQLQHYNFLKNNKLKEKWHLTLAILIIGQSFIYSKGSGRTEKKYT